MRCLHFSNENNHARGVQQGMSNKSDEKLCHTYLFRNLIQRLIFRICSRITTTSSTGTRTLHFIRYWHFYFLFSYIIVYCVEVTRIFFIFFINEFRFSFLDLNLFFSMEHINYIIFQSQDLHVKLYVLS